MTDNKVSYQGGLREGLKWGPPQNIFLRSILVSDSVKRGGEHSRSRVGGYPHKHRLIPFHSGCAIQIYTSRERPTAESFQEQSSESKDAKILSEVLSSLSDPWIKALFSGLSRDGEGEGWGGMATSLNIESWPRPWVRNPPLLSHMHPSHDSPERRLASSVPPFHWQKT